MTEGYEAFAEPTAQTEAPELDQKQVDSTLDHLNSIQRSLAWKAYIKTISSQI